MVDYILKYETSNLIIIYCYIYSGLLGTIRDIVQNSIKLIKSIGFSPYINGQLK